MPHDAAPDTVAALRTAIAPSLAARVPAPATIAVALSGGRDSVVLLDALLAVARRAGHALAAIHVHHGLSPNADAWQHFCADWCAARGVALHVRRITVPRLPQTSLEGEARRLRYAALADAALALNARVVALAHHRDDQAETLLLQLLRGAGPHGLSAMSEWRADPRGVSWWRPLLAQPRAAIDAYARDARLAWVDDESNALPRHRRNALRHLVMPALAQAGFAQAGATLARAAAHQADAALLADDLAAHDARDAYDGQTLARAALRTLPAHRGRNLLRWFLRARGLGPPSAARLAAMLQQLTHARDDARVCIGHDGAEVGVYHDRVHVHAPTPAAFDVAWSGEATLVLPHGRLSFAASTGADALDPRRLAGAVLKVRLRIGGERLQLAPNRPRRALKDILQDAGVPAWERSALPLVVCGGEVVAVPGIGVAADWQAPAGASGIAARWHPVRV